jgi:hypothetical protein
MQPLILFGNKIKSILLVMFNYALNYETKANNWLWTYTKHTTPSFYTKSRKICTIWSISVGIHYWKLFWTLIETQNIRIPSNANHFEVYSEHSIHRIEIIKCMIKSDSLSGIAETRKRVRKGSIRPLNKPAGEFVFDFDPCSAIRKPIKSWVIG